ncbi:hypothetical protein [Thioclava sediminum]|nr:hypothetical protein [Thioclava sediminum]
MKGALQNHYSKQTDTPPITLDFGGTKVEVDSSFRDLPADRQNRIVDEIALRLKNGTLSGNANPATEQNPGLWQALKDNVFGDNDPNSQNFGEKVGSALNKAGEAMTFGLIGDEAGAAADAALGIGSYDNRLQHYRQQEHVLQRDNPKTALGAELGGAVLGAMAPGGAIGTLGRGAGLLPRLAASTATGAAMGGTYGFMEGEGGFDNRMSDAKTGAKVGAAVGFAAPVVGRGVQKLADGHAARQAITKAIKGAPSSEALRAEGRAAYDAIDRANVQIQPQAFDRTRQRILNMLRQNTGFDELPGPGSLTPNSARAMEIMRQAGDRMAKEPTAALPFKSLDQMRRQAGAAAGNFANKTDQKAGMEIISGLDDLVKNLAPGDVVSGDVQALKTLIPKARDVWSRMSKSQMIDDAIEAGQNNYLSGGASGIRNQFKRILSNKKLAAKFTEAEKAAMRKVVNGSMGSQIMNLLGGGLGQLGQIGAGFGLGGPAGAAAGAVTGSLARRGSEVIASRNAEIARAMVANGKLNRLPVASESSRRAIEALMRRGAAPAN